MFGSGNVCGHNQDDYNKGNYDKPSQEFFKIFALSRERKMYIQSVKGKNY